MTRFTQQPEVLDLDALDSVVGGDGSENPLAHWITPGIGTYFAGQEAALMGMGQHQAAHGLGLFRNLGVMPVVSGAVDLATHGVPRDGMEWLCLLYTSPSPRDS